MRTLTYYEQPHVTQAFGQFVADGSSIEFATASTVDEVERHLSSGTIDGIIVPRVSIPSWWDIEEHIGHLVTVPRIIAVARDPQWPAERITDLGFDGLLIIDFENSSNQLVDDIRRLVTTATTRGARPPVDRMILDSHPELHQIIDGDPINQKILALMSIGRADREIARAVFLSPQTVRNRVSGMLTRANMRNRTELTLLYLHRVAVNRGGGG